MSSFTSPLIVEITQKQRKGRALARVMRRFTYYTDLIDAENRIDIVVPKGLVTDFASVPRFLWVLFPPLGPYAKASVVHDFLIGERALSSKLAANIFREAMQVLGVGRITIIFLYYGVLWFGPKFELDEGSSYNDKD